MKRFSRRSRQGGSGDGRRLLSVGGRMKVVAAVALVLLAVGVVAAYGALGSHDTQTGTGALAAENGGDYNTADGYNALYSNTTGQYNTAVGVFALTQNTTGSENMAAGNEALTANTTGDDNMAAGVGALHENTTGGDNTAAGVFALYSNTTGGYNTAVGYSAAYGAHPNTTGSNNTFLGSFAGPGTDTQLSNATAVGANAVVSQSDSLVLGAPGVNVGVNTAIPQSRVQIGTGATTRFGDYLQVPVVINAEKTPPAGDCNSSNLVGRLVLQQSGKKMTLWACSPAGVWTTV